MYKNIDEYVMVVETDPKKFEIEVHGLLSLGWCLHGTTKIGSEKDSMGERLYYAQAMVKPNG